LQARLGASLDIALLLRRAEGLGQAATALAQRAAGAPDLAHFNAALMRASRALVPLDYTQGDRFRHDPALEQHPWPSLQPLRLLADAAGTPGAPFLRVAALQASNRAAHALRQAIEALEAA
jgi:hypothetical protein